MGNFVVILLLIAVLIFGPIALIWSINTLFGLGIAFTLKTWFAAFFIVSLFVKKLI